MYCLLETARERSITARANQLVAPSLEDQQRIRRGAGNYDAMCAGCHLSPHAETYGNLPGSLSTATGSHEGCAIGCGARVLDHQAGLKATGMPAWGKSMEDEYIWDMVAFLRKLPVLTADNTPTKCGRAAGIPTAAMKRARATLAPSGMRESDDGHSHEKSGGVRSHEGRRQL